MATNPGPFSEYLQKQLEQPQQQPRLTGYEGAMGNIANIATQFLQGIKQGRIQRFAQEQEEEERNRGKLIAMADFVQKSPDLTPAAKQSITGDIYGQLFGLAASVPETSKHTGHPLTDTFKSIFTNLTGGELKKQPKVDLSIITGSPSKEGQQGKPGILERISAPESQIAYHKDIADKAIAGFINDMRKRGETVSKDVLFSNPDFIKLISEASGAIGEQYRPILEGIPDTRTDAAKQAAALKFLEDEYGQPPTAAATPTAGAPRPALTMPQPAVPPISPFAIQTSGPASREGVSEMRTTPTPTTRQSRSLNDAYSMASAYADKAERAKALGVPPPKGAPPKIDATAQDYTDPSLPRGANVFKGVRVTWPDTGESDVYSIDTNKAVPGAITSSAADKSAATPEKIKELVSAAQNRIKIRFGDEYAAYAKAWIDELNRPITSGDQNDITKIEDRADSHIQNLEKNKQAEKDRQSSAAQAKALRDQNEINDIYTRLDNSKEYTARLSSKNWIGPIADEYAKIQALPSNKRDYSVLDKLIIRAMAKITDPTTGVRDSEAEYFANAAGITRQTLKDIENIFRGQGEKLPDGTRLKYLNALDTFEKSLTNTYNDHVKKLKSRYSKVYPSLILEEDTPSSYKSKLPAPIEKPGRTPGSGSPSPAGSSNPAGPKTGKVTLPE